LLCGLCFELRVFQDTNQISIQSLNDGRWRT
jgi:hypothetical protein